MIRQLFFELRYFFQRVPWDTGQSPPELLTYLAEHQPGRAIDLGCGTGTNVITLAQHGWRAIGIDFSRQAIRRARRKAARLGIEASFIHGSVTTLEGIEGPFDLGVDIGCFHALTPEGRRAYVSRLAQVVGADGTVLLYAFLRAQDAPRPSWTSEAEVRQLFAGEFAVQAIAHGFNRERPSAWFTLRRLP